MGVPPSSVITHAATDSNDMINDMNMISIDALTSTIKDVVVDSMGAQWQAFQPEDPVRILSGIPYSKKESSMQSLDVFFPTNFISPIMDVKPDKDDDDDDDSNNDPTPKRDDAKAKKSYQHVKCLPVFVFIHGGGWSRGGKSNFLYGAPSICKNMCTRLNCIAISIGYRLGKYPEFMYDAALGISWVHNHIEKIGGDLNQVYLSGHSAGAHIASLLMIRYDKFLKPLDVRRNLFHAVVLISGVYDLFCPLQKMPLDAKNKTFVLAYVIPAFGNSRKLRQQASPLLLLNPKSKRDTSILGSLPIAIWNSALSLGSYASLASSGSSKNGDDQSSSSGNRGILGTLPGTLMKTLSFNHFYAASNNSRSDQTEGNNNNHNEISDISFNDVPSSDDIGTKGSSTTTLKPTRNGDAAEVAVESMDTTTAKEENNNKNESSSSSDGYLNRSSDELISENVEEEKKVEDDISPIRRDLPPTLILNAGIFDMGLTKNGKLMTQAIQNSHPQNYAQHQTIPNTEHASICWTQTTADVISYFLKEVPDISSPGPQRDQGGGSLSSIKETEYVCESLETDDAIETDLR